MRIGLFGGTFDPPHAAHRAACLLAMKRIGLDRVWWLVTPGNPLKDTRGLAPLAARVVAARALAHDPRIDVTDLEARLGTRYTYQTVELSGQALPAGAFRLDHGRRQSAQLPPLAALARHRRRWCRSRWSTGSGRAFTPRPASPARRSPMRVCRRSAARALPERKPPAWIYLHGLKSPLSSTALRAARARHDN